MRYSKTLIPTLKEAPAEAQVVSHILLIRGGDIRKVAAGIYSLLPLGMRVVHKVARIIREEPAGTRAARRPRAGLMRGRKFTMKDPYSFHTGEADAKREYRVMYDAYTRIFRRCGLEFRAVEADTGAIGGNYSHEFQVLADSGEDAIVSCDSCGYAANVEKAELPADKPAPAADAKAPLEELHTTGKGA